MGLGDDKPETNFRPTKHETPITAFQLWQLNRKKRDLRQAYLEAWEATAATTGTGRPLDAIISPLSPWPAPPHGYNSSASYTMVFNFLDYPAMAIPVTRVDPKLDQQRPRQTFYNDADKAHYDKYDPNTYKNSPVGIQVVGRTLEEEAVLGMADIIDKALKAHA
jgi:amidase